MQFTTLLILWLKKSLILKYDYELGSKSQLKRKQHFRQSQSDFAMSQMLERIKALAMPKVEEVVTLSSGEEVSFHQLKDKIYSKLYLTL